MTGGGASSGGEKMAGRRARAEAKKNDDDECARAPHAIISREPVAAVCNFRRKTMETAADQAYTHKHRQYRQSAGGVALCTSK
jgi:hypothetical protein